MGNTVRFHASGTICEAKVRACPLGEGDGTHFDSPEALARHMVEKDMDALDGGHLTDEQMQEMDSHLSGVASVEGRRDGSGATDPANGSVASVEDAAVAEAVPTEEEVQTVMASRSARQLVRIGASPTEVKKAIWLENPDMDADGRRKIFEQLKQEKQERGEERRARRELNDTILQGEQQSGGGRKVPQIGKVWEAKNGQRFLYVDKRQAAKAAGLNLSWSGKRIVGAELMGKKISGFEASQIYGSLPTVSVDLETGSVQTRACKDPKLDAGSAERLGAYVNQRVELMVAYAQKNGTVEDLVRT